MNAITPSNNSSGGKVKFFTGGSGGGGQTISLLPIIIGSNNATTTIDGVGMIPLNATQWLNDGGDNANDYDDSFYALSYLPRIDNPYYYYLTTGTIQAVSLSNADVDLDLIVDGVIIETISITLNSGNGYTSEFAFTQTPQLNEYPVERYGVRLNQRQGTTSKFLLNTTNVFLSVWDDIGLRSEFFTSSNLNGLEFAGNDKKYFGFGGQTNTNSAGGIPFVRCIVGDTAITQVWKVYFMLSQNAGLGENFIRIGFYVDDNLVEEFDVGGDITAYTPQEFTLTTPTQISLSGSTFISIYNSSDTSIYLFEVGICGYEILD